MIILAPCWTCHDAYIVASMPGAKAGDTAATNWMHNTGLACRHLWLAGVARFLSIMSENDAKTMSVQQQRSQLFRAASQLVGLSRYGSDSCVMNATL